MGIKEKGTEMEGGGYKSADFIFVKTSITQRIVFFCLNLGNVQKNCYVVGVLRKRSLNFVKKKTS